MANCDTIITENPSGPSPTIMPQDANRLIWIDLEMSGLNPDTDKVLEVAIVVTDSHLATVAEAPVLVLHQTDAVLAASIFCLGTTEFMIAGLLPTIASDLGVSISSAGLLISGFAIGMAVGTLILFIAFVDEFVLELKGRRAAGSAELTRNE